MSDKINDNDLSIKKSYTNSLNLQPTQIGKKLERKESVTKRLNSINFGIKPNISESKINQEEEKPPKAQDKANQVKSNKSNLDEPAPETVGQYYEERKKIIFGHLKDKEKFIKNLIIKTQLFMDKQQKIKISFFGEKNVDIYNKILYFKETVANYCLVINIYLRKNQKKKAFELFLLMATKNKVIIEYFFKKIKELLSKISNSNRIGKFFPSITKIFIQLLSIFIKLSCKFSKSKLENYYVKFYLKTIYIVSETVIKKFHGINSDNDMDNDIKLIGRYFYTNCIFDASIYFFIKYQPLIICTFILQHILDLYQDKLFSELMEVEQVLLLKVNYNLGLFLYSEGYSNDAINYFNQARNRLLDIKLLPLTKEKKEKSQGIIQTENSSEQMPIITKMTYNFKRFGSFINEKMKRGSSKEIIPGKIQKNFSPRKDKNENFFGLNKNNINNNLRVSLGSKMKKFSSTLNKKQNMVITESDSMRESLPRKSSGVLFGNQIMALQQQCDNMEEKIYNEIELILSEIEISKKNYKEALKHIKKLLPLNFRDSIPFSFFRNSLNVKSKFSEDKNNINQKEQASEINYCNFYILPDSDRRKIMLLLEKIEHAFDEDQDNIDLESENSNKYINYYQIRKNNLDTQKLINSKEMEKFFIFICGLSSYQLKVLNESQPMPSDNRDDLPIIFNNQFKDCLTNAQRMSLCLLESMSLSRYIILKNTNKNICPENFDFTFMKYRIKDSDSENEKENNKLNYKSRITKNIETNNTRDISTNNCLFNNTSSSNIKTKNFLEEENTIMPDYDTLLNNIKNIENEEFINSYKNKIIQLLKDLDKDEQKLFLNSSHMLKKLIKKMKKGMIKKEKNN